MCTWFPRIRTSICGCALRCGTVWIAAINLVYYGILLSVMLLILTYSLQLPTIIKKLIFTETNVTGFVVFFTFIFALNFLASLDLLYAAKMEKKYHLAPFSIMTALTVLFWLMYIIYKIFMSVSNSSDNKDDDTSASLYSYIGWIILIGTDLYILLHLYSYYAELSENENQ